MYLANPWGLLGLLSLPAILYIHFYRRHFPPRQIAGLFLWLSRRQESPSGKRRQKPPVTLSLILELLAALLATLLLSDPRLQAAGRFRHLVFVLDSSASMTARGLDQESSAERAVAAVKRELSKASPGVQGTVVLTGPRPSILGRTAMQLKDVSSALESYRPGLAGHDSTEALNLALDIAGTAGEVFFLSDYLPPENHRHKRITYLALGKPSANVGFVGARWGQVHPSARDQVFLRISNFSDQPQQVVIKGRLGEVIILERELTIAEGGEEKVFFKAPSLAEEIHFELSGQDGLEMDNRIVLMRPARKVVRVANLLGNSAAGEQVVRAVSAIRDVKLVEDGQPAHLTVCGPGQFNPSESRSWRLVIGPLTEPYRSAGDAKNMVGPFLIEQTHPLTEGVGLGGVIWAGAVPSKGGLTPIVSGGEIPLISLVPSAGARAYWLNLDLARSNLSRSPDWPILIDNLVQMRRADLPGLSQRSFALGQTVRYVREDPGAELTVSGPAEYKRVLPPASDTYVGNLPTPGVYRISSAGKITESLAVNLLDEKESDLRTLSTGRHDGQTEAESVELAQARRPGWLSFVLGALILGALLGNWWLNFRSRDDL